MLYGLKFMAIKRMFRIYDILQILKDTSLTNVDHNAIRYELVSLIFSLITLSSSRRNSTEQMVLEANSITGVILPDMYANENTIPLTFL